MDGCGEEVSALTDHVPSQGVIGLGHIVLYVRDIDRSIAFYRDLLGWPTIAESTHPRAVGFSAGNSHHDLLLIEVGPDAQPIPPGRRVGMYHFGVKVGDSDDALRAVRDRLLDRPDLANLVGIADHLITHSIYVLDPDGNEVELYVDMPGIDWTDPANLTVRPRPLQL